MIRITGLKVPLDYTAESLRGLVNKKLRIGGSYDLRLVKRSVDARNKENVYFNCTLELELGKAESKLIGSKGGIRVEKANKSVYELPAIRKTGTRPVVVGFGPAGMFAALILAQCGLNPIIVERGESVEKRQETVNMFWDSSVLNPESNVQFGEGGAGTFSDGKLTTGTKNVRIGKVFDEFVKAGAPAEILYDAKPHIGTDKLPAVVKNIRETIISLGGEVKFETKVTDFIIKNNSIKGVKILSRNHSGKNPEEIIECEDVILAAGHSARDIFSLLKDKGIPLEAKAFSVGARIEHPREVIDKARYGKFAGNERLGSANYNLSAHLQNGRGVYTFCMCPGGVVTGAASEEGGIVTNGMSRYKRDDVNSNAALLVGVTPDDFGSDDVLAGVEYQRKIERAAYTAADNTYLATAQRIEDFLAGRPTKSFASVAPSYLPGTAAGDIGGILPDYIADSMREGIRIMARSIKCFDMADGVLTAPETRSSSPVRILRNESLQSPLITGLYPCGEGAGYAGGIVSAAVDGIRCAEMVVLRD